MTTPVVVILAIAMAWTGPLPLPMIVGCGLALAALTTTCLGIVRWSWRASPRSSPVWPWFLAVFTGPSIASLVLAVGAGGDLPELIALAAMAGWVLALAAYVLGIIMLRRHQTI